MITLTIRTDKPKAEVGLYRDDVQLAYDKWMAHRKLSGTIHSHINEVLQAAHLQLENIKSIVVFAGPGSFTGLRIGISVANALAYSLKIPITGANSESWIMEGRQSLLSSEKNLSYSIVPEYGMPAHTTEPRK